MSEAPCISIVDDDPSVTRALARLCRSAGYDVVVFDSAEAFLDADAGTSSACLILDVHLPGMSGPELHSRLAKGDHPVPTVFITAFDGEDVRRNALDSGARAFLRKPVDSDRLLDVLRDVLAGT